MYKQTPDNHKLAAFEGICGMINEPIESNCDQLEYDLLKIVFDRIPNCGVCAQFVLQFGEHIQKRHPTSATFTTSSSDQNRINLKLNPLTTTNVNIISHSKEENETSEKLGDSPPATVTKANADLPSSQDQPVDLPGKNVHGFGGPFKPRFSSSVAESLSDGKDETMRSPGYEVCKTGDLSQKLTEPLKPTPGKDQSKCHRETSDASTQTTTPDNTSIFETPKSQRSLKLRHDKESLQMKLSRIKETPKSRKSLRGRHDEGAIQMNMSKIKETPTNQDEANDTSDPSFTEDSCTSDDCDPNIEVSENELSPFKELDLYSCDAETPEKQARQKKEFKSKSKVDLKVRSNSRATAGRISHKCRGCLRTFVNAGNLKVHYRARHAGETGDKPYKPNTKKSLNTNGKLKDLMKTHTEKRPLKYNTRSNKAASPVQSEDLPIPSRVQTDEQLFDCKICDKTFTVKYSLISHMRIHTEGPFECNICKKTFAYRRSLIRHLKTHGSKKPE